MNAFIFPGTPPLHYRCSASVRFAYSNDPVKTQIKEQMTRRRVRRTEDSRIRRRRHP
jgi:hypothetical protein